ncbi:MAG: PEP-CTERM sorting domain-containing protein [Fuerstiella sp.]
MSDSNGTRFTRLALTLSLAFMCQQSHGDVIGSDYSVGGTIFADNGVGGGGIFAGPGATTLTFDGTSKSIGALARGTAGDELFVDESQTNVGNTFTVGVSMVARDAMGDLTTWAADGTVFDNDGNAGTASVPFALSFFDLATGNAGSNTLEVNIGSNVYNFVSSEALLFATDGAIFSFGDGPTSGSGPSGLLAASVGFNAGDVSDAVAAIGGREIAGYGFSWTYELNSAAAVPEPSSFALLGLGAIGAFVVRRRRTNKEAIAA